MEIPVTEKALPGWERDPRKEEEAAGVHSLPLTAQLAGCHLEDFLATQPDVLAVGALSSLPQLPLVFTSRGLRL